jgi:hypothetical protein
MTGKSRICCRGASTSGMDYAPFLMWAEARKVIIHHIIDTNKILV